MKNILGGALALGLLCSTAVHAAGYGIVDLEKIVEQSVYIKQQNASMQQQIKPQTAKIESLTKELEALQQRAQQNTKLSDAEKKSMTQQQKVQGSVESSIQALNRTMDSRIKQVAEQLRKENNLDVVLNKNSALAYDAKYDLTDKMIQKVNAIK